MEFDINRRSAGQWMTDGNPFYTEFVRNWIADQFTDMSTVKACEPYAVI